MTKNEVLNSLRLAGVSRIVIDYDGSQDEGYVGSVTYFGPSGDKMPNAPDMTLAIEELVFDILGDKQGGWELDDGTFGEVEINVATGVADFTHTRRVTTYQDDNFDVALTGDE